MYVVKLKYGVQCTSVQKNTNIKSEHRIGHKKLSIKTKGEEKFKKENSRCPFALDVDSFVYCVVFASPKSAGSIHFSSTFNQNEMRDARCSTCLQATGNITFGIYDQINGSPV